MQIEDGYDKGVYMYQELIEEVLGKYGMTGAKTELIRHNENMTYQVAGKYLLRIHKHAEGFSSGPFYEELDRIELFKNELAFIIHLKEQGMNVQVPIPNKAGELVTLLADGTPATMLTWIPGHIIDKNELVSELCYQIGQMVAKLHKASRDFPPVCGLQYDDKLCERLKGKLNKLEASGVLEGESTRIMIRAFDVIAKMFHETRPESILVHSDLSLSNILITDTTVVPIDFSLFGYCHPMMDIAALYCNINGVERRSAIAEGYKALGGTIDFHALDCCFALNILLGIILHCESWTNQEWFQDTLARWCRETFDPLGNGKAVISPEFYMLNAR
jgi:Ser/Thr protein kinase RdoA (MazF antagonist)